jgi:hypothetical protein
LVAIEMPLPVFLYAARLTIFVRRVVTSFPKYEYSPAKTCWLR